MTMATAIINQQNDDDSYYYRTAGTKTKLEDSRLSGAVINNR
jgi:hypothetical protein